MHRCILSIDCGENCYCIYIIIYTVSQKIVPTVKLSVTLSKLNRLSKFLHCCHGNRMKFATKPIWHYPPHLRHVATLPREIINSNFLQMWKKTQTNCILIVYNFVIHPHILIFSVFKIAILSSYWLQIKFSMSLLFYLLMFAINLWHRKFVTADVTAVFINNQYGILYIIFPIVCMCALTLYPARADCAAATDISGVTSCWQLSR